MDTEMNGLLEAIANDYLACRSRSEYFNPDDVDVFRESLKIEEGRKYLKIIKKMGSQTCVWGFVVKGDDDKKFQKGDILKAASWAAPARNKARGNIFEFFDVRWTGPNYL